MFRFSKVYSYFTELSIRKQSKSKIEKQIFFEQSSGFTENNLTQKPITKEEVLLKVIDQPQIQTNVFVERGKLSGLERIERLGEIDNIGDLEKYGYEFFNIIKI